jgi:putative OPT family oligopeptide transporter
MSQVQDRDQSDAFPLIFGVIVSTLLAGTLVIAGLKAGITPGVSPLVILFAWGAFTKRIARGNGSRFLNIAQVAGSAGMAVTAGVIFTAPLVQILYADRGLEVPPVDVVTLIILSVAGSLIGFGFVGLGTRKFLTDPTLPAPEARACETMIEAAVADAENRPRLGRSLYLGLAASFLAPLLVQLGAAKDHIVLMSRRLGDREFSFDLPMSPIYIGIGGLLTLSTALLVFGGSMLRLIGDYMLAGIAAGSTAALDYPANSMRWVGGGAMTVAVAYSLVRFFGVRTSGQGEDDPLVVVDPPQRRRQSLAILVGIGIIIGWLLMKDGPTSFTAVITLALLACCSLMVMLGAILSLQIGSSASPVSGTIFVTTLVLCATALLMGRNSIDDVLILTPLLVAACVAVCTANDSSQDYKTMQLCGVRVQDGFKAQILGLLGGCLVVPVVLYISHEAYTLGSDQLTAPQGQMFATLIDGLLLSTDTPLPWSPILLGLAVGAAAVSMDVLGSRKGLQLPAMALAVGIYLPPALGVGILIGAGFRWFGEGKRRQTSESILTAAGLITGAALLELILGSLIVAANSEMFSFELSDLLVWRLADDDPSMATSVISATTRNVAGVLGILTLAGLLWFNSRGKSEER